MALGPYRLTLPSLRGGRPTLTGEPFVGLGGCSATVIEQLAEILGAHRPRSRAGAVSGDHRVTYASHPRNGTLVRDTATGCQAGGAPLEEGRHRAELQRELIVANTNDGLASARARAGSAGARLKLTEDQAALAQRLYDEREKTVRQIADMFGVLRSTVYGHLDKTKTVPRQPKKPWS